MQAAYSAETEKEDIKLTTHEGQECDIVIEGQLEGAGRRTYQRAESRRLSIYYDSGTLPRMIAVGGKDCLFYAIVLNLTGAPIPELTPEKAMFGTALQEFPGGETAVPAYGTGSRTW